jgi:nucleotide-binding universal stress UspA family protein
VGFFVYQRILVPVDGSDASRHALREALLLAGEQQGRL